MNDTQIASSTISPCPCGIGETYSDCCKKIHDHRPMGSGAETCEQLMRSRYSAYALGLIDYLIVTTHPQSQEKGLKESIERSIEKTTWLGLSVIRSQQGGAQDKTGKVEFIAKLSEKRHSGKIIEGRIHELSRFSRYKGNWVYLDGELY